MQISFKAKVPISTCNIYNKESQQLERATLYEIDCKDKSDYDYVASLEGCWAYKKYIEAGIFKKNYAISQGKKKHLNRFYSLESQNGVVAGLCETIAKDGCINIQFIETNPARRYKYAGQTILASLARLLIGRKKHLSVKIPDINAESFYSKTCQFNKIPLESGYILYQKDMDDFIKRTQERVGGLILDYNCT